MAGKKILIFLVIVAGIVTGYVLIKDAKSNDNGMENIKNVQSSKSTDSKKLSDASTAVDNSSATKSAVNSGSEKTTTNNSTNNTKPMGLEIKTTQEGAGERAIKSGDHIYVHYTGKLTNGTVFDSSVTRGVPFDFTIGQGMVIAGWEQGFIGAKIGEKRTLTIPAELGYGARDMGTIPANSILIFDVEVIDIK
jgi:peptidylprolyl isomerase/FKBP-type peptidyl-prolyl cis-trans isomerase FkpA